ncbi:MAG: TonB-dependent receptor [Gammaproteobacteria bacterium]
MSKRNPVREAVSVALTGGVAAVLSGVSTTALAQDSDVLEQPRQTVTGSRILRATTETSSPVTTITRDDIEAGGEVSIAEVLRRVSANTFGSFREVSGVSGGTQGNSAINLRGLGSDHTLVLLDGRRFAPTAAAGFFSGSGAQANLNLLPFAAVERIEILRDGASAIYGADAVAGVINIILRKDFEGVSATVHVGRPTQEGGDEEQASLVGGVSSARGNITFSVDHSRKSSISNGDRTFSAIGLSAFGFPGSLFAYTPDMSPGGPFGTRGIGTQPDPRCPASLGSDPNFPDSAVDASGTVCQFNYAATSHNEARIKRQSVFVNGNFEIGNDLTLFTRAIVSQNESFGRYAPTPHVGGVPFLPTMAATNPNNPTVGQSFLLPDLGLDANGNTITLTTSTTYNGPFDLSIFYRNIPGGFRDTTVDDDMLDLLAGVQGSVDLFGGAEWEVALQHSRTKARETNTGLGSRVGLQQAIDDSTFDVFGVNGPTSPAVAATFLVDGFSDNESVLVAGDASITFDLGELPSGPVSWAWGIEYQDLEFTSDFDAISNQGNIDGSSGGVDVHGERAVFSAFGEALIPVLSNLELDLALRYDSYNDFGNETSPKVGVAYRPIESVLLRGTYGEGFRAPDMSQLYGPQAQSFNNAVDTLGCTNIGDSNGDGIPDNTQDPSLFPAGHPCVSTQYNNLTGGNPLLEAETSESWGAGFVWSPTADITLGADYYAIETTDQIAPVPLQTILDREAMGDPFFSALVTRNPAGKLVNIVRTNQNISGVDTQGVDIEGSWNFGFDTVGDFKAMVSWTHILEWDFSALPGDPFARLVGQFQADDRAVAGLGWQRGDFTGQLNWNYISTVTDALGSMHSAWNTFDLQFGWATPWQGKVVVGARNVTNEDPPFNPASAFGHPFYLNTFHDVYGRIPYVRYEQDL